MHMAYKYRTGSEYEVLAPLFGTLTFITTLYAGWVARSGAVSSTHDVGALPSASIFFWSTILLLVIVLYLSFMKIKDAKDEEGKGGSLFTLSHMFDLTAIVLIILAFISFFGERVIKRMNLYQRLKTGWRRSISKKEGEKEEAQ